MKQYRIDELRPKDMERLIAYMDKHFEKTCLEGTYWLELPKNILTQEQAAHKDCSPHVISIVAEQDRLTCEFLIRTPKNIHCSCMGMADASQRTWIMEQMDAILEQLSIRI